MIEVSSPDQYLNVLTREALIFLETLHVAFNPSRVELLNARSERSKHIRKTGALPDFPIISSEARNGEWSVASIPHDLRDRRVEITGPPDRKMVINALNSGAKVFMADFEDSLSPTWKNVMTGQINLFDAVRKNITYEHPVKGTYTLDDEIATLMVRPRGLHLNESHVTVDDEAMSAGLIDFGLYFYHNVYELIERGTAPYFYLPKIESYAEARWWNNVFNFAQDYMTTPRGTIRATVLIETLPAAYQMEEILYELRTHSAGLNCGRWDYIFSYIKTLGWDERFLLPDRQQVTMVSPFMDAYARRLIGVCHRRGAHAMGGMAAQIPIKGDPSANHAALAAVRRDKIREVTLGHDGTWVAHPALVSIAMEAFNASMKGPNQIHKDADVNVHVSSVDLRTPTQGVCSRAGLFRNVDIALRYIESWLRGAGCVPLYHMMEDAATAEISRAQIWQWTYHGVELDTGEMVTMKLVDDCIDEVVTTIKEEHDDFPEGRVDDAAMILRETALSTVLEPFLTTKAYAILEN